VTERTEGVGSARAAEPSPLEYRSGLRRGRPLLRTILTAVTLVALGVFMARVWGDLSEAFHLAVKIPLPMVALALLAECVSTWAWAALYRYLLHAVGHRVPARRPLSMVLADTAVSNTLPGGTAIGDLYNFQQFRRWGVEYARGIWCLVVVAAVSTLALVALVAFGLAVTGDVHGHDHLVVEGACLVPLTLLVLVGLARPAATERRVGAFLGRVKRSRTAGDPPSRWRVKLVGTWRRLEVIDVSVRVWMVAFGLALANWVTDWFVLLLAVHGLSVGTPWPAVLVAFAVGQIASLIPLTPGGLGFVEGGMAATLVAAGGKSHHVLAAVLVYRAISVWIQVPIGWVCWIVNEHRRSPDTVPTVVQRPLSPEGATR